MSTPLDFEEAREAIAWEPVFRGMGLYIQVIKERERRERRLARLKWDRHWRMRLARRLRHWAIKIELPAPE